MIIQIGDDMTISDKERIMLNMKNLYYKTGLFTLSIWLSKDSRPNISVGPDLTEKYIFKNGFKIIN